MTGSAIFNILLIPAVMGVVVLVGSKAMQPTISQEVVLRDGIWLMAIQGLILWFIDKGEFGVTHSVVLLSCYVAYLWRLVGENKTHETHSKERDILLRKRNSRLFQSLNQKVWRMMIAGVIVLGGACFVLVESCIRLSEFAGWSITATALVVAAAATSVPDMFISVRDATKGTEIEGISNAIGSNIFDLSVALGLPLLIYTLMKGPIVLSPSTQIELVQLWLGMMGITAASVSILLIQKRLTWIGTGLLIFMYVLFVGLVFSGAWS